MRAKFVIAIAVANPLGSHRLEILGTPSGDHGIEGKDKLN